MFNNIIRSAKLRICKYARSPIISYTFNVTLLLLLFWCIKPLQTKDTRQIKTRSNRNVKGHYSLFFLLLPCGYIHGICVY